MDGSYWLAPGTKGLSGIEGNLGASTTVSASGWNCAAGPGASCAGRSVTTEQIWTNLLLRISTNATGNVLFANGFGVREYDALVTAPSLDSWEADYFALQGGPTTVPVPAAAWLFLSALAGLGFVRRFREEIRR